MLRYLVARLGLAVFVVIAVLSMTFFMLYLSGDPAQLFLSELGGEQKDIDEVRRALGYDRPVPVQYLDFMSRAIRGDFGNSIRSSQPAMSLLLPRLPYTAVLAVTALSISLVVAVPAGVLAAMRRRTVADRVAILVAVLGQSVPSFVVGIMLILIFAVWLRWLPVAGGSSPQHIILPAITLSLLPMARIARITRTSMLEVITLDYVTTARSKGLAENTILRRHVLRNAALPVLTIVGLQLGTMLTGAVVVETIFGWPGIGLFAVQSLLNKDVPLVQATVAVASTMIVFINLVVDLLYAWADPRIRYT